MKRLFLPCVLGLALYLAVAGGEYNVLEARRAQAELEARRVRLQAAHRQIDSLRARVDSLQHDDAMLERFARERYGFIRDGEFLYRILEPVSSASPDEQDREARGRAPVPDAEEEAGR